VIAIAPQQFLVAWSQIKNFLLRDQTGLPPRSAGPAGPFPLVYAGPPLIKALARALGKEESYLSRPDGKPLQPTAIEGTADIRMGVEVKESSPAQNVVGVLEGSDPNLKGEYVAFSAHYDHEKTENGVVYNGADDDGSGTSAVLEIAQAFAVGQRPKRSVLVIFHTAEELGLYGSAYNTDHDPVVPLDKIVANLNIDMIGRSRAEGDTSAANKNLTDKNSVYIIGADRLSTELHKINEQTNAETERLRFDYKYNAPNDPENFYERSDHFNYAKHGIPVIFYFTGVHRDYHKPTDDVDKIDFQKMERITRMIFATGYRVVNLDHRLAVDKAPASRPNTQ
jgi:Zn-dependent M28 family amino/carboxypeptidase